MRKIESLQENEVIEIKDAKDARLILNRINKEGIANSGIPMTFCYVSFAKNRIWWQAVTRNNVVLPASDFIKKSKTKQRIKALEARMDKIEHYIDGDDSEVSKDEPKLEVLPEKWCVKMDRQEVVDYCNVQGVWDVNYHIREEVYFHQPVYNRSNHLSYSIEKGYTEVSFDDFKRLVLDQPKEIDFSVAGQLVNKQEWVFLTTGKQNEKEGFFEGVLMTDATGLEQIGEVFADLPKNLYTLYKGEPITLNPTPCQTT